MRHGTERQEKSKHVTRNNQEKVTFSLRFRKKVSQRVACIRKRQNVRQPVHAAEPCRIFELYEVPQLLKLKGEFQSAVAFYTE